MMEKHSRNWTEPCEKWIIKVGRTRVHNQATSVCWHPREDRHNINTICLGDPSAFLGLDEQPLPQSLPRIDLLVGDIVSQRYVGMAPFGYADGTAS